MKYSAIHSRSMSLVALLCALGLIHEAFVLAGVQKRSDVRTGNFMRVNYCDLVGNPNAYDGKTVTVGATYRYGFEWQELFCVQCRDQGKTWLEFDPDSMAAIRRALNKAPRNQGTLNARFYGVFRSAQGPYGDGGYTYRFDLNFVEGVEIVSKSGGSPESLSANEQKKLCGGAGEKSSQDSSGKSSR
jgi:hypothetical protein